MGQIVSYMQSEDGTDELTKLKLNRRQKRPGIVRRKKIKNPSVVSRKGEKNVLCVAI